MRVFIFLCCWLTISNSNTALAKPLSVVTSIPPLQSLAANLLDRPPALLFKATQSPHQTRLKPSMLRLMISADVIFAIKPTCFEQSLQKIQHRSIKAEWINLLDDKTLIKHPNTHHHDHAESHHHDTELEVTCHDDPHVWLDPQNAIRIARIMQQKFSQLDPANAENYTQRLAALETKLQTLDEQLKTQLEQTSPKPYVLYHNAFQYFEQRYHISSLDIVLPNPEIKPGLKTLSKIRRTLADGRSYCLFTEPQFPTQSMRALSRGLPVRNIILDPLGQNLKLGKTLYFTLLQKLADGFTDCFKT